MIQAIDLNTIELMEIESPIDPARRLKVAFPISSATGTAASACVYFELQPGAHVGVHTDSAEEFLIVLEGRGEGLVGEETASTNVATFEEPLGEGGPQVFVIGGPMPMVLPLTEPVPA